MADALKTFFSPTLVRRIGASIEAVHPGFRTKAFVRDACDGLDALELLDRGRKIAAALHVHLPASYPEAVAVIVRSLGAEHANDELEGAGMAPFFYLPHTMFVATHGLEHFDVSMRAQHELTRRFTCEFSIRPFLERYPEETLAVLARWTKDRSPHVRRLVSEGTRPKLPWAPRVRWIEREPQRLLPLLEALKDDPASVVRRSVANHLNDLWKSHPDLVNDVAARWLDGAAEERRAMVKHALRSAVKKGDRRALALLGFGAAPRIAIERIAFAPRRVSIGGRTRIEVTLRSTSARAQSLVVDLAVHFVKARGKTGEKVFKVATATLAPREVMTFGKNVSLAVHTTRKPNPGRHHVELLVNGARFDVGGFAVVG